MKIDLNKTNASMRAPKAGKAKCDLVQVNKSLHSKSGKPEAKQASDPLPALREKLTALRQRIGSTDSQLNAAYQNARTQQERGGIIRLQQGLRKQLMPKVVEIDRQLTALESK